MHKFQKIFFIVTSPIDEPKAGEEQEIFYHTDPVKLLFVTYQNIINLMKELIHFGQLKKRKDVC